MSINIDGYDITEAEYGDLAETNALLTTVQAGVISIDNTWGPGNDGSHWLTLVAAHPATLYIKPMRPAFWYEWDDVNEEWVVNQTLFNPIMFEHLDTIRDEQLEKPCKFTVGSTEFYIKNDQRTQNAIAAYDRAVAKENDADYSVFFYAKDGEEEESNNIDVELFGSDIQMIDKELTRNMKKIFEAHRLVRVAHAVTPFTTLDAVTSAFNSHLV